MNLKIVYALILTVLPISELRVGLPLAISYALDEGVPILLVFLLVVLLNVLLVFFVFYFLDRIHSVLLSVKVYRKSFDFYLRRLRRRIDKFERNYSAQGFLALMLFVAVPLPGTGAWTGCVVAWLLGLERRKCIFAISAGVIIAGILILFGTLGFFMFF